MAPRKNSSKTSEKSPNKRSPPKQPDPVKSPSSVGDSDDEDYRKKRDRNNQAVKRSRVKSKMRTQQTMQRVSYLKNENSILEEKVNTLTKELGFLKELFLAHAGTSKATTLDGIDMQKLLSESSTGTSYVDQFKKEDNT